jgi:hypothetical protein
MDLATLEVLTLTGATGAATATVPATGGTPIGSAPSRPLSSLPSAGQIGITPGFASP